MSSPRTLAALSRPSITNAAGTAIRGLMTLIVVAALNTYAWSQSVDTGRNQFLSNCAACHGTDGKGNGPLAIKLKTKPTDLTRLAKRNNGVFSPEVVYKMIDGTAAIRTHLSIEMPIWGCRHTNPSASRRKVHNRRHAAKVHTPSIGAFVDLACDPEPIIKDRILSIVEYLSHIQENNF